MAYVVLFPHDAARHGVAGVLGHPRHGNGIAAVHPVAKSGVYLHVMNVTARVGFAEICELGFPTGGNLVAVVAVVAFAHVKGERKIAEADWRSLVRMTGHHGGGSEAIGHAWRELIHAIATGGVAHEVNTVGVDVVQGDEVFNKPIK